MLHILCGGFSLFAFWLPVASCQFPVASALAFSLLFFNLFAFACPARTTSLIYYRSLSGRKSDPTIKLLHPPPPKKNTKKHPLVHLGGLFENCCCCLLFLLQLRVTLDFRTGTDISPRPLFLPRFIAALFHFISFIWLPLFLPRHGFHNFYHGHPHTQIQAHSR